MTSQRFPLRINIGFLVHQQIGIYRDMHFEFPELHLHPDFDLYSFSGGVRLSRTPQGVMVQGDFKGSAKMECVRCLTEFNQPLRVQFDELFAFNARSITESGLMVPDDGNIDLAPLVREYMLLEVPIRPMCREDCKGLCIVCGADLNLETCEHQRRIAI